MYKIKNELKNYDYSISSEDLKFYQSKFDRQVEFLENSFVFNEKTKTYKSFLDLSKSCNFSFKYHCELNNRLDILNTFKIESYYIPIFITATLDGVYRDLLYGNYSRITKEHLKSVPKDIRLKMMNQEELNIIDLKNLLNYKMKLFNNAYSRQYKNIKIRYCKVFEPHKKDGVPHLHMILFIPNNAEMIEYFKQAYIRYFPAPQNLKTDKLTKEQKANGELNGFQISIKNSVAYVMKYIQKTFINLRNTDIHDIKLDKLRVWYMKYKIRRFTMSRFACPLWIYRKINCIESLRDYYFLNLFFENKDNTIIKDYKNNSFYFHLKETKQVVIYSDNHLIYECELAPNRPIKEIKNQFEIIKECA